MHTIAYYDPLRTALLTLECKHSRSQHHYLQSRISGIEIDGTAIEPVYMPPKGHVAHMNNRVLPSTVHGGWYSRYQLTGKDEVTQTGTICTHSKVRLMKFANFVVVFNLNSMPCSVRNEDSFSRTCSGSSVSHSISYTVPHSYNVSSTSKRFPSHSITFLVFLNPPRDFNP